MTSESIKEAAGNHSSQEVKRTKTRTNVLWRWRSTPRSKHQSSFTTSLKTSTRTTDVTSNLAQMHSFSVKTWRSVIHHLQIATPSSQMNNCNSLIQSREQVAVMDGNNSSQVSQLSHVVSLPKVSSMIPSSSIVNKQWQSQATSLSMILILLGNLMWNTSSRTWILQIGNPSSGLT